MTLPKYVTTVTPFSKYLAMALFIILPFVGFYLGMQYQKMAPPPSTPPYAPVPTNAYPSTEVSQTITPKLSCRPRPACLDATPRCMIAETSDMCPPPTSAQKPNGKMCTMEAKLCPDGKTWVGRVGPNCEFAPCPK